MAPDVELVEIRDFLAGHPPFEDLPAEVLDRLPRRLGVEYHRRGTRVLAQGVVPEQMPVLRSGAVEVRDGDGLLVERCEPGTSLAAEAVAHGRPYEHEATAIEDTLVLTVPADVLTDLAGHEAVARLLAPETPGTLRPALERQQGALHGRDVLRTRVREVVRRPPVSAGSDASIREAARVMSEHRVSSLLVMDGDRLAGILTDRDLRNRVLAGDTDPDRPVRDVMTTDPVTGGPDALALEVLLDMVGRNIHHLPIVEHGRVTGMVTTTDLMRLQQANPVHLVGDLDKAPDVATVAALARRLGSVVETLVAQDASAHDIGRVVTLIGDAVERRLLQLAEERLGPPPVPYAWLTLGSRARYEQALNSDQDHAMVLHDEATPEHAAYFGRLADLVTDGLVEAGYPRCPGDMMATNPQWRVSLAEWRQQFDSWFARPSPEALLHASTFLDLRHVAGDADLAARLREHVRRGSSRSRLFLDHLAKQAYSAHPPLGIFRGLVVDKTGEDRDTLDIKRGGAGIVVKVARVHGLDVGSRATSSRARIADAVDAGRLSATMGSDLRDAWEFLSYVRLRHQAAQVRDGAAPDNRVRPDDLSTFEKRHLREAFRVVRLAQQALAQRFQVTEVP